MYSKLWRHKLSRIEYLILIDNILMLVLHSKWF